VSSLACCLVISTGTCTSHSHPLHCLHGARSQRRAERIADERTRVRSAAMDHRRQRAGCPPVGTDRPGGARRRRRCRLTYVRQACPAGPPAGVESASAGADPHRRTEAARSGPADRIGSDHGISIIIRRSCRGSAWSARLRASFDRGAVLTKRSVRARRRISRCLIDVRASVRRGAARCDAARSARHRRPSDFCGRTTAP
jgi:hypothetical protein